jgi:hypothetical protein
MALHLQLQHHLQRQLQPQTSSKNWYQTVIENATEQKRSFAHRKLDPFEDIYSHPIRRHSLTNVPF